MTFKEIASLAIAGVSVGDIKELGEMAKTNPEVIEIAKTGAKLSDIKDLISLAGPEEASKEGPSPEEDKRDPAPDYQKLYEESQKKLEELSKTVSKIQSDNAAKDISDKDTQESDIFMDILNSVK